VKNRPYPIELHLVALISMVAPSASLMMGDRKRSAYPVRRTGDRRRLPAGAVTRPRPSSGGIRSGTRRKDEIIITARTTCCARPRSAPGLQEREPHPRRERFRSGKYHARTAGPEALPISIYTPRRPAERAGVSKIISRRIRAIASGLAATPYLPTTCSTAAPCGAANMGSVNSSSTCAPPLSKFHSTLPVRR